MKEMESSGPHSVILRNINIKTARTTGQHQVQLRINFKPYGIALSADGKKVFLDIKVGIKELKNNTVDADFDIRCLFGLSQVIPEETLDKKETLEGVIKGFCKRALSRISFVLSTVFSQCGLGPIDLQNTINIDDITLKHVSTNQAKMSL